MAQKRVVFTIKIINASILCCSKTEPGKTTAKKRVKRDVMATET